MYHCPLALPAIAVWICLETVCLIGAVATVVVAVATPRLQHALLVVALVLVRLAHVRFSGTLHQYVSGDFGFFFSL